MTLAEVTQPRPLRVPTLSQQRKGCRVVQELTGSPQVWSWSDRTISSATDFSRWGTSSHALSEVWEELGASSHTRSLWRGLSVMGWEQLGQGQRRHRQGYVISQQAPQAAPASLSVGEFQGGAPTGTAGRTSVLRGSGTRAGSLLLLRPAWPIDHPRPSPPWSSGGEAGWGRGHRGPWTVAPPVHLLSDRLLFPLPLPQPSRRSFQNLLPQADS